MKIFLFENKINAYFNLFKKYDPRTKQQNHN